MTPNEILAKLNRNKPMTIGSQKFGIKLEHFKKGLSVNWIIRIMRKASKENLLKES